ncbi:MAG: DUF1697 domain-containing protein [Planctomycetota bacterium]
MTATHVALLRGINVGRAKRIAMADLRALFESLGFGRVRTLLNSGNVVFDVPARAKKDTGPVIEAAIQKQFGIVSRVTVIRANDLDLILAENPLLDVAKDPSKLLVSVPSTRADLARLTPLVAKKWGSEALAVGARAAYCWSPKGVLDSEVNKAVAKLLGDSVTSRNWTTMSKLQALANDPS